MYLAGWSAETLEDHTSVMTFLDAIVVVVSTTVDDIDVGDESMFQTPDISSNGVTMATLKIIGRVVVMILGYTCSVAADCLRGGGKVELTAKPIYLLILLSYVGPQMVELHRVHLLRPLVSKKNKYDMRRRSTNTYFAASGHVPLLH